MSYADLITSQHRDKPKFRALVELLTQHFADCQVIAQSIPRVFDIDTAVGVQLDVVGQWAGVSRLVPVPIDGVYFTFDIGPGFDVGLMKSEYDSGDGLTSLPDDYYRQVIKAKITANHWDGSLQGMEAIVGMIFQGDGYNVSVIDNQDMSVTILMLAADPNKIPLGILKSGMINIKPTGVDIKKKKKSSNTPVFCFDIQNDNFAGFDSGCFYIGA